MPVFKCKKYLFLSVLLCSFLFNPATVQGEFLLLVQLSQIERDYLPLRFAQECLRCGKVTVPVLTWLKNTPWSYPQLGSDPRAGKALAFGIVSSLLFFVHISCICGSWTEFLATN